MDFQSRINQFRQGLSDQQDNFDRLASNASQFGRTVLPDKVAQHYQYVEQVGGLTTGSFAAAHGGTALYKRVKKIRQQKQAKQNNSQDPTEPQQQRAKSAENDASQQEQRRTIDETEDKPEAPQNPSEVEVAADAEGRAKGGKIARSAEEAEGDDEGGAAPKAPKATKDAADPVEDEGAEEENPFSFFKQFPDEKPPKGPAPTVDDEITPQSGSKVINQGTDDARIGPDTTPSAPDPELRKAPNTAEERAKSTNNPATEGANEGGGAGDLEESVLAAKKVVASNIEDASGEASSMIGKGLQAASKVGDLVGGDAGKEIAGKVATQVGEKVGGEALANVAADAIPILGEAVGLGTLIYGIVKAHRHEENNPGPQLSKANPEASEQTGGFEGDALKSLNVAPSVV